MRTADGEREVELHTYALFAERDPLADVMERMLAGVSTRSFARIGEPVGSAIDRGFGDVQVGGHREFV